MTNKVARAGCCGLVVAAAATGGVNAQEAAVTLFGAIDVSVRSVKNGNGSALSESSDGMVPTRLGFRGLEDLGNGWRAGFWLESGFSVDSGAQLSPTKFFNRRSTVSLAGPYGEIRLGRDLSPTWLTHVFHDVFNGLGLGGSVNLTAPSFAFNYLGSGTQTAQRTDNGIAYFLPPNLGGLYGEVLAAPSEGVANGKFVGARLGYRADRLDTSFAFSRNSTAPNPVSVLNGGVTYDIGFAKLQGLASETKAGARRLVNMVVGAAVPVGASEFKASFGKVNASGGGTDANDARQVAAGYVYNLSKRTALYGTYARISNRAAANYIVSPLPSDPLPPPAMGLAANAGRPSRGVDLGLRHTF